MSDGSGDAIKRPSSTVTGSSFVAFEATAGARSVGEHVVDEVKLMRADARNVAGRACHVCAELKSSNEA